MSSGLYRLGEERIESLINPCHIPFTVPTAFEKKVYYLCSQIPEGKVSTYKEIAHSINSKAYQAVGQALKKNPYAPVPCHRVVASDGKIGGFKGRMSPGALEEKRHLLQKEGILFDKNRVKDLKKLLHTF